MYTEGKVEVREAAINAIDIISKEDGSVVAQVYCEDDLGDNERDNAKRFMLCWNSHDKLLAACEAIQTARDKCRAGFMAVTPQIKKELDDKLDAAIAEAKPQETEATKAQ